MTLDELRMAIRPLISRVRGIVNVGVLESTKDDTAIQLVKITTVDEEVITDAERVQPAGVSTRPKKGAGVVVLSNQSNKDHPIVIAVDPGENRPKNLEEGDSTFYDEWGNKIEMKETGTLITDVEGNTINMDADGINMNVGDKGVARLDDTTISEQSPIVPPTVPPTDADAFWTWVVQSYPVLVAAATLAGIPYTAALPTAINSKINSSSDTVKAGD